MGVIDAQFRGEVCAPLENTSDAPYEIVAGNRLLQAVAFTGVPITLELVSDVGNTSRGNGAFASM